jgi:hypothetical protein
MTRRMFARVAQDTKMSAKMFDALMDFEIEHLPTPHAVFTREDVINFLKITSSPEIATAFKDYYLLWAPDDISRS